MAIKKVLEGFPARNPSQGADTDNMDNMDSSFYEFYYLYNPVIKALFYFYNNSIIHCPNCPYCP